MNIVWILNNYPPVVLAGAEFAAHRLNKWLLTQGHTVTVYIQSRDTYPAEFEGVSIKSLNLYDCYTMNLPQNTILVSQLWATRIAHSLWDRNVHCKYVEFVHYVDRTVISPYPWTSREFTMIYNSQDTKRRALEIGSWLTSKPSYVIPPFVEPVSSEPSSSRADWITLVNFSKDKGADIFNRLAEKDTTRKYVGIKGSHGAQETPHSAVELLNPTLDMESVWKNTRILVILSTYETWSMVATEAMQRGIPVVCADHIPALKENCEDAAIYVDRQNIDACIAAFQTIESRYDEFRQACLKQVKPLPFSTYTCIFGGV